MPVKLKSAGQLPTKLREARHEISETIAQNPIAAVFLIALVMMGFALHQEVMELRQVCDLVGAHDVWTDVPKTPREAVDDICLGHDPNDNDTPENP